MRPVAILGERADAVGFEDVEGKAAQAGGGELHVRDVESRLGGMAQQPGLAAAGEDFALDTDDGGDMRLPSRC